MALLLVACSTPQQDRGTPEGQLPDAGTESPAASLEKLCYELQQSPSHLWPERIPPVQQAGAAAERFLVRAFVESPAAPGGQATLATLGRIGGDRAIELCAQLVKERAPLAVEAALALGELPAGDGEQALMTCMQDLYSDVSLRAAAACSLARHGEREHSPAFLAAIVRAGTPAGRADEKALGLPGKSRWARERYFVQRTLRKLGHDDLCDAFDSDAPWPVLEKLAPRVEKRLAGK